MRHLLDLSAAGSPVLQELLDLARRRDLPRVLEGRGVALLFEKPSARTRHATEMAVVQLGGHPVSVRGEEVGLDSRETAEDLVRTLAQYHAVVGARVGDHELLERMAGEDVVPVLNLLSDRSHPCQALADLLTLRDEFGRVDGLEIAFVGDAANNVARSLAEGCVLSGAHIRLCGPEGHVPDREEVDRIALLGPGSVEVVGELGEAVDGVHAVYTDVWVSMGQERERESRAAAMQPYRVDESLMGRARPDAIFLHCLPAHRGEEVTAGVIDGPRSRVWQQARNRLDAARAVLAWLAAPGASDA
ncbi:MAG: ornithine carbamoyltransferase [Acidimicrobiales bacterium]|nr:MAG: ornithine carbamoyltransferase [Acidimicrobiales bacterium]